MQNPIRIIRDQVLTPEERSDKQTKDGAQELREKQEADRQTQLHEGWKYHPITQQIIHTAQSEFNDLLDLLLVRTLMFDVEDSEIRNRTVALSVLSQHIKILKNQIKTTN